MRSQVCCYIMGTGEEYVMKLEDSLGPYSGATGPVGNSSNDGSTGLGQ